MKANAPNICIFSIGIIFTNILWNLIDLNQQFPAGGVGMEGDGT